MRRAPTRRPLLGLAALALVGLGALGCGNEAPPRIFPLEILTPADFDPLENAASVTITVDASPPVMPMTLEVQPDENGRFTTFSVDFTLTPSGQEIPSGPVRLEAFDDLGELVARGSTPIVPINAQDTPVVLWVGAVGRSAELPASETPRRTLLDPRADAGAIALPFGAIVVGGRGADGPSGVADFYNAFYHSIDMGSTGARPLTEPQARPTIAPLTIDPFTNDSGARFLVLGGERGAAEAPTPFFSAEVIEYIPAMGSQFHRSENPDGIDLALLERTGHSVIGLEGNQIVLVGGSDAEGTPRREVVVLEAQAVDDEDPRVTLEGDAPFSLVAARQRPALAVLQNGQVIVLGGGTAEDPPAERLNFETREAIAIALEGKLPYLARGAGAVRVGEQRVVAVGGRVPDEKGNLVPTNHVAVLRGAGDQATVTVYDDVLSEARADATVTLLPGPRVLVAGGVGADGEPLGNAEVLELGDDGVPTVVSFFDLARPRAGHVAVVLPTGDVLLAGGRTAGGELTGSLELYTPRPE